MPLCYLRRPLFLALAVYIAALCALRGAGFLSERPDPRVEEKSGSYAFFDAQALSAPTEDYRGFKIVARAKALGGVAVVPQKVMVEFPAFYARQQLLRPGETARFFGRIEVPSQPRNPGGFDERAFLEAQGVSWTLQAQDFSRLPVAVSWPRQPLYWAQVVREKMQDAFFKTLQEQKAHVLSGLVFGDKGGLSPELRNAVQNAGVMHLLVPSGAKVALVLLAAAWFLSWLGLSRALRFLGAALIAGFYTIMVGAAAPYARAYFASVAYYAALLLDRDSGAFQGMVLSAWLILLCDPRALFSAGFEMTYLAMLGLAAADAWAAEFGLWPAARRMSWAFMALKSVFATATVELMLWPVFAGIFGQGPLLGSFANVILIPYAALLMPGGFLLGAAFIARWKLTARAIAWILSHLLGAFCRACSAFSALPFSAMVIFPMHLYSMISYYLMTLAFLFRWPKAARIAILCAAAVLWSSGILWTRIAAPELRATYLWPPSSGLAIVTTRGQAVVLASGPPRAALDQALRAYRIERVDEVILTPLAAPALKAVWRAHFPGVLIRRADDWSPRLAQTRLSFAPWSFQVDRRQFDIIASLLKGCAVEIEIYGHVVSLKDAGGQTSYLISRPVL